MASSRKSVVCKICFSDNNETIDLIKTICRDKVKHQNSPRIRVYWDGTSRCLEQVKQGSPTPIRPFPPNWIDRGRRFVLCHGVDKCYGPDCYYPHSLEEQDVWNSKLSSSGKMTHYTCLPTMVKGREKKKTLLVYMRLRT